MAESRWTGSAIVIMEIWLPDGGVADAAHAHRNHRLQRLGRRPLAVALEQRSHRAGDGGEADVVERAADAARRPQLVAPGVVADERAPRADRRVERTRRRR